MMPSKLATPDVAECPHSVAVVGDNAAPPSAALPTRPVSDVATGLAIVGLCLATWALTTSFDDVPAALTQGMGPAAFPRLVLGVTIVLALALALTASSRQPDECETVQPMVYTTVVAVFGVVGAMALLGIHGAIIAACIGMGRLWGERRLPMLAVIALGMSVSIHFAFVRGFGIGLPRGWLQIWLS